MNVKNVTEILGGLSLLKFFPSDDAARARIVGLVCAMATTETQVEWLVNRMTTGLYNEWPGPREMRACFCSKFKPADGINAYSDAHPDGIPSEKGEASTLLITSPDAGAVRGKGPKLVSADPDLQKAIMNLAELKSMEGPRRRITAVDIPVNPNYKPITQADIDEEVARNRVRKAQAELLSE